MEALTPAITANILDELRQACLLKATPECLPYMPLAHYESSQWLQLGAVNGLAIGARLEQSSCGQKNQVYLGVKICTLWGEIDNHYARLDDVDLATPCPIEIDRIFHLISDELVHAINELTFPSRFREQIHRALRKLEAQSASLWELLELA